jgi:hypothetical protein
MIPRFLHHIVFDESGHMRPVLMESDGLVTTSSLLRLVKPYSSTRHVDYWASGIAGMDGTVGLGEMRHTDEGVRC